jgi:hypothetical protein
VACPSRLDAPIRAVQEGCLWGDLTGVQAGTSPPAIEDGGAAEELKRTSRPLIGRATSDDVDMSDDAGMSVRWRLALLGNFCPHCPAEHDR